jgi:4-hydroxythreonine-4-phosphate dehydrogenase
MHPFTRKRRIIVTPGDPEGIGPEVFWKALSSHRLPPECEVIAIGSEDALIRQGARFSSLAIQSLSEFESALAQSRDQAPSPPFFLLAAPTLTPKEIPSSALPGYQSGWSIQLAVELLLSNHADALVTGPISKERLQSGGYPFPGHTEFLAHLCRENRSASAPAVTMMLANEKLRVSLVTTHIALSQVASRLSIPEILRACEHTRNYLSSCLKIERPRIAVAALNPHAGEGGLFGSEEDTLIRPAIRQLQSQWGSQVTLTGPHSADTLFARHLEASLQPSADQQPFDAVVCMYHDQGLIPVKLLDFGHTVNVTLGLPIIRTSVDHGVAFDIAGKGIANPSSFQAALDLAIRLADNTTSH